ncbi:MAG TPA: RNA-binding domain-containing protein, partial [Sphingobacterium sp.]|nr:RNA-binding domain-containing protein [Sphingobacterium sp.]
MKENPTYPIPSIESETVEFKSSFQDEVIVSLVAFANAKGGSVYVGVGDKGEVKGASLGKETVQNWINEIKIKTQPSLIPDVEVIEEQDKTLLLLNMQEYPIKPVSFKGKCYRRIGNSNHLMGVEEIANEHLKTINGSWDFYPDPHHSLDDISLEKVSRFMHRIEQRTENKIPYTPVEFLTKMEMLREGKLTFGAYLLFVTDYCLISDVQVGRFKSNITIIDSISLNTDLFSEVDEIIAFIKKHLMVEYIITGEPQRTERFDYPLDAIREIVINMIVHRDYRDSSGSVIKIFDNRIEFYNPGKLFGGITIDDLVTGNYSSKSRNKLIAKAFKEVGLIERYGSGIHRV